MTSVNPYDSPSTNVETSDDEVAEEIRIFSFSGRIGRLRLLAYQTGMYLVLGLLAALLGGALGASGVTRSNSSTFLLIAILPIMVCMLAFSIVQSVRRIHDIGWSAWLVLLNFVPYLNFLWGLLLIFVSGTPGRNRFGPRPPPNSLGVKLLGFLFPIIVVIGILAAITLPAYQNYAKRAHAPAVTAAPSQ